MVNLRRKLAFSYGLLIVIIVAVGAWSIYHLVHLSRAIDVILVNNYKSIIAAENMKEALERQDSAAMFFIASHEAHARQQFQTNVQKFKEEYDVAASNITEPGEAETVRAIDQEFTAYRLALEAFMTRPASGNSAELSRTYFEQLGPAFLSVKSRLDELLRLNQDAMVRA